MEKEYDIDSLVSNIDFNSGSFQNINGMMLTNQEIEVLDRYKIPYQKCSNLKEIIYEIEEIINDSDIVDEDLDYISSTIAERDYYQNTNK